MHIHFSWTPEDAVTQQLERELAAKHPLSFGKESPSNTEVLVNGRPTLETLESLPQLHALLIPYAGLNASTRETLKNFRPIDVYNIHHNADSTAEMAIGLMIAAMKHIPQFSASMKQGIWSPPNTKLSHTSLYQKKVVILGYGAIGKKVARICAALDMQVSIVRRKSSSALPPSIKEVSPDQLDASLKTADILQLCIPLTEETKGLLSKERIAMLPAHAVIINTSRAQVVDEKALFLALKENKIKAAGLDVWWNYPKDRSDTSADSPSYPSDLPFHTLPNLIMTPHRGGDAGDLMLEKRRIEHIIDLIHSIASGEKVTKVNVHDGY